MKVIFATEPIELEGVSIFLAGPTPRLEGVLSWRPDALKVFETLGFEGTVLVPEDRSGVFRASYDDQVEWEEKGLTKASCIMFWVPRSFPNMPGMTTNDEWGFWKTSGKVVWGNPPDAVKVSYQLYYAEKFKVPVWTTLEDTIASAIRMGQFHGAR